MLPDKDIRCPATAFAKTCHSIVTKHKCPKWVNVKGSDPQNGAVLDHWGCSDTFLPMLLVENARQSMQTGAAVESFRNEMVVANGIAAIQQQILNAAPSQTRIAGPQIEQEG